MEKKDVLWLEAGSKRPGTGVAFCKQWVDIPGKWRPNS
jgi:hypothetical protein